LARRIHGLRTEQRGVEPDKLNEADRRGARMLFEDLSLLGRAPTSACKPVFPPLPGAQLERGRETIATGLVP
jgi:hypothetical protein